MPEKIPRRMMRFYRKTGEQQPQEQPYSETGRPVLGELPSMGYEDVEAEKRDEAEKKKPKAKSMEDLALEQVKKFSKENKRMPTDSESDKIAENIYTQLKGVDTDALYGGAAAKAAATAKEQTPQHKRGERAAERQKNQTLTQPAQKASAPPQGLGQAPPKEDLKKMESDEEEEKELKDEFNIGLEGEAGEAESDAEEDEVEEVGRLDLEEKEICPNCSKETEKIIYCPKCGAAYCDNCAKKDDGQFVCPKCGTKTKG